MGLEIRVLPTICAEGLFSMASQCKQLRRTNNRVDGELETHGFFATKLGLDWPHHDDSQPIY
jgi:hypothetical protein